MNKQKSMLKRDNYAEGGEPDENVTRIVYLNKARRKAETKEAIKNIDNELKTFTSKDHKAAEQFMNPDADIDEELAPVTEAKNMGGMMQYNMGGSMLMPPEREGYVLGAVVKKGAEIGKKVSSAVGANLDDAVTATGRKSQGARRRADGTLYSAMGDSVVQIKSTQDQFKGAGKAAAVFAAIFGGKKAYDKLTTEQKTDFQKAFSKAHNADKKTFMFEDKEFTTEVKRGGKMSGGKMKYAEGSMLMPPEMEADQEMPVDTYDNIPPDEMEAAEASQLPDEEMEDNYLEYVLDESLDQEDQEYLMSVLESDERLSGIFDKVMDVAGEFSGEGEVDGPGTGVSDSIPARLSDGEFVVTEKATDQIGSDNLQTMMDDAEQAYDGGYMKKAFGGMVDDIPTDDRKEDEEINSMMIASNQMPSVRPR